MKKGVAIWFLCIYLLQLAGNSLIVDQLLQRHERIRLQQIDRGEFDPVHLVEISIPVHTPYYSSSVDYERYYGNFEREGRHYNFVMRKIINDSIFLLCLPDDRVTALESVKLRMSLAATGNDDATSSEKQGTTPVKKGHAQHDFCQPLPGFEITGLEWLNGNLNGRNNSALSSCFIEPPLQPPSAVNQYCISRPADPVIS